MADDDEEAELYGAGVASDSKQGENSTEANDNSLDDVLGEKDDDDDDEAGNDNGDDDDGWSNLI
jgi:hypothetical protein